MANMWQGDSNIIQSQNNYKGDSLSFQPYDLDNLLFSTEDQRPEIYPENPSPFLASSIDCFNQVNQNNFDFMTSNNDSTLIQPQCFSEPTDFGLLKEIEAFKTIPVESWEGKVNLFFIT